jgi:CrcB protein
MTECLIVGVGGFIGSVCRYLIGLVPYEHSSGFPLKTFFINIIGAFLIGLVAAPWLPGTASIPGWPCS